MNVMQLEGVLGIHLVALAVSLFWLFHPHPVVEADVLHDVELSSTLDEVYLRGTALVVHW